MSTGLFLAILTVLGRRRSRPADELHSNSPDLETGIGDGDEDENENEDGNREGNDLDTPREADEEETTLDGQAGAELGQMDGENGRTEKRESQKQTHESSHGLTDLPNKSNSQPAGGEIKGGVSELEQPANVHIQSKVQPTPILCDSSILSNTPPGDAKISFNSIPAVLPSAPQSSVATRKPTKLVKIDDSPPRRYHPISPHWPGLHTRPPITAKDGESTLAITEKGSEPSENTNLLHSIPERIRTIAHCFQQDWQHRHDNDYQGFWWRMKDYLTLEHWARLERLKHPTTDHDDTTMVEPKYRWTPVISGIVIPFSILLEIPGLTEPWYVRIVNNVPVEYQNNSTLLEVALGISMFFGLCANVAIIVRFMEKKVYWSTIAAIICITSHDVINLVTLTIFGVTHRFNDGFTYSAAFWSVVCSSVVSVFNNVCLIYDFCVTKNFAESGSGLMPKQRSLGQSICYSKNKTYNLEVCYSELITREYWEVVALMVLLIYMGLGSFVFSRLLPITYHTAMYFVVVSLETIGFGDITPSTTSSKIFWLFYEPIGIINLALAVSITRDTLLEAWESAYKRRKDQLHRKITERKRQRAEEKAKNRAIERHLSSLGAPIYVGTGKSRGHHGKNRGSTLNKAALSPDELEQAHNEAEEELKVGTASPGSPRDGSGLDVEARREEALEEARKLQRILSEQSLNSEAGYKQFIDSISAEERRERLIKFIFAFSLFVIFWLAGAGVFAAAEDWSYFIAIYFCMCAFLTVGYGDYVPTTAAGKSFFIFWAFGGVPTMTLLISVIVDAYEATYRTAVKDTTLPMPMHRTRRDPDVDSGNIPALEIGRKSSRTSTMDSLSLRTKSTEDGEQTGTSAMEEAAPQDLEVDGAVHQELMELPYKLLDATSFFNKYVHFFVHGGGSHDPPKDLKKILEEACDENGFSGAEREAMLSDPASRKLLFMMSYERTLQSLVDLAQNAILLQQRLGQSHLLSLSSSQPYPTETPPHPTDPGSKAEPSKTQPKSGAETQINSTTGPSTMTTPGDSIPAPQPEPPPNIQHQRVPHPDSEV